MSFVVLNGRAIDSVAARRLRRDRARSLAGSSHTSSRSRPASSESRAAATRRLACAAGPGIDPKEDARRGSSAGAVPSRLSATDPRANRLDKTRISLRTIPRPAGIIFVISFSFSTSPSEPSGLPDRSASSVATTTISQSDHRELAAASPRALAVTPSLQGKRGFPECVTLFTAQAPHRVGHVRARRCRSRHRKRWLRSRSRSRHRRSRREAGWQSPVAKPGKAEVASRFELDEPGRARRQHAHDGRVTRTRRPSPVR